MTRQLKLHLQGEAAECGLACLVMILGHHGYQTDVALLRGHFPVSMSGQTARSIVNVADKMGLGARVLRLGAGRLPDLKLPVILHWDMNHFVVLKAIDRRGALVLDPGAGELRIAFDELLRRFTGVAIEFTPSAAFTAGSSRIRFSVGDLWSSARNLHATAGLVLALSLAGQLVAVAIPFALKGLIDRGVGFESRDLVIIATSLILGLYLLQALNRFLRDVSVFHLGRSLHAQVGGNLFRHMLGLTLPFYEKRNASDIVAKFEGLHSVRAILADGFFNTLLDAVFFLVTLGLSATISLPLTAVFVGAFLLVATLRLTMLGPEVVRQEEMLNAENKSAHHLMESVRGIATVKLGGFEAARRAEWQNLFERVSTIQARVLRARGLQTLAIDILRGLEHTLILLLGGLAAMKGAMSLGALFAVLAYRQQFYDRAYPLLDGVRNLQMIRLHVARLGDIVGAPIEPRRGDLTLQRQGLSGAIAFQGVWFRHDAEARWILKGGDVVLEPSKLTVIIGPSGAGKTTFAKLLLGLLTPTHGHVAVDGVEISGYGLSDFRAQIGAVMQGDILLTGSIAKNVAGFDTEIDLKRVIRCCEIAGIAREIEASPMGYETLIGGLSSPLSAGQTQRVMLARALYKQPKVIVLDEGTANLDPQTERAVLANLAGLSIGVIAITHRPEVIRRADRIVMLNGGELLDLTKAQALDLMLSREVEAES